ncbi:hypothetical protein [Herpetosiphon geysericola]|uniref:Uncharacterized protein n=1 Tax=Herpetosiphon geysericola TaxID=70996 RepID=A0A0N8GSR3_9CHLR|nr:hypothetical protein [Herpetosiphon geysericola]KPL90018.1 hypothetical protein SE18_08685 [Herpetosiphon geysericola]
MKSKVYQLSKTTPGLGKAVQLLVDGKWRCYLWQGDSWQRFDDRRDPLPTDRWKPLKPTTGKNYRQPT